ncbi:MAG: MarR family transcriptional regulator [Alphaproteobacteria bacterium]|nr:MAG: MarR family transcriptional regulator [Alphaproteobacteria bacterium]
MTDINSDTERKQRGATAPQGPLSGRAAPKDTALMELVELLFFAYRDFTAEPDAILAEFGFGRAHHRVLHFVNRHPGLRVADLLVILKITKQSLGRVLKQLVDEGYIEQRAGQTDRRERLLYPTARGAELAARLAQPQLARIADSLENCGDAGVDSVRSFLYGMISEADRSDVADLLAQVRRAPGRSANGKRR